MALHLFTCLAPSRSLSSLVNRWTKDLVDISILPEKLNNSVYLKSPSLVVASYE